MINLFEHPRRSIILVAVLLVTLMVLLTSLILLVWRIPLFEAGWWQAPSTRQISLQRWKQQGLPVEVPFPAAKSEANEVYAISDLAFDGNSLWVTEITGAKDGAVFSMDPRTFEVKEQVSVGEDPRGILFDGKHIWVANHGDSTISCFSTEKQTNLETEINVKPEAVISRALYQNDIRSYPTFLAFDGEHIWVTSPDDDSLWRLPANNCEADSNDPDTKVLEGSLKKPMGIIYDGTYIWIANQGSNEVVRLDPDECTAAECFPLTIKIGQVNSHPANLAYDGTFVWVTLSGTNEIARIHARTGLFFGQPFFGQPIKITQLSLSAPFENTNSCSDGEGQPDGVVYDGKYLWIAGTTGCIHQLRASDAKLIGEFNVTMQGCYGISQDPKSRIVFDGTFIWIMVSNDSCAFTRR